MNQLPTARIHAIDPQPEEARWLVKDLWSAAAVGIIGGAPKACKSFLALDLAVSVASGTACLGRFEVERPGPALVYLAEDPLVQVRDRVTQLCQHRGLSLEKLPLHVITAPSLRLDVEADRQALDETLSAIKPRLLVLDPLVRLHKTLDENSSADISRLLGFLRELNRRHEVAVVLVHHMAKRARRDPGQSLRGSSDLHAWTDSACYLFRRSDGGLRLKVEHRAAAAPEALMLHLAGGNGEPCRLELEGAEAPPPPLADAVRRELRRAPEPLSRAALRKKLRVKNVRLGEALQVLEERGLVKRCLRGWSLPPAIDQLDLTLAH
jgi:AAA domain